MSLEVSTKLFNDLSLSDANINSADVSCHLPTFLDFTDLNTIRGLVSEKFNSDKNLKAAQRVAERVYETLPRPTQNNSYGASFSINPEVLAYAMQAAKGQTVVEFAGAGGENSALLAFSGAERVYMNDIDHAEIERFQSLMSELPSEVRGKLEAVEGSCFDVLAKKPELENKVGLVLCRNLIHFFNDQEQTKFFDMLKQTLKPGGIAILTANSVHIHEQNKEVVEGNPSSSCFEVSQCLVTDYMRGTGPIASLYFSMSPVSGDNMTSGFTSRYLYEKNFDTGLKWKVNNDEFKKIDAKARPLIKEAVLNKKQLIKNIQMGSVRVLTSVIRIYSEVTLESLCRKHGFHVERALPLAKSGHLMQKSEYGMTSTVGVIIKYQC